ncbi:41308_t:CDS:2, partial [Gigaspora margarita]
MSVASGSQVLSLCYIEQNSIDEILPTFDLQVLFIYSNEQSSQFILSNEILPTFDSQVLSVCSNRQSSQSILNNEILPTFDSQVLFICSNEQKNEFINYDISDRNEHQNIEFKDQEKLEIVSALIFQTWKQLDHHIRMYAKQNSFVLIITCSKSDDITRRRYQYACEHQDIGHSKKIAILENQKQAYTKRLEYKWLVNASCPKKTRKIKINSCYLEHLKQEIKYYTLKGLSIQIQLFLLEDKYPNVLFLLKDLSDTIQFFKKQNKVVNEAFVLLETLFNTKHKTQIG